MTAQDLSSKWLAQEQLVREPGCGTFVCDGYKLGPVATVTGLLEFIDAAERANPGHRVLATLDGLAQANDTSAETIEAHGLDDYDVPGSGRRTMRRRHRLARWFR